MDFLLGESDVVMDVPYDDTSKLSRGTNEKATQQSCEPKNDPEEATTPRGLFRFVSNDISQVAPDPTLLLTKDGAGVGSSSICLATPGDYVPK